MALRRGRVHPEKVQEFIRDLSNLPIQIEKPWHPSAWSPVLALGQQHRLTAYDAADLELAQRTGLPLATLDSDLQRAARSVGVALLEPELAL
jgi:predicted nucleic acid-binding protein